MAQSGDAGAPGFRATLLKVAWLSILLGLGVQALSMVVALGHGNALVPDKAVADALSRVSWATLVCVGVAAGMTASGGAPAASGLAGLVAAPIAFGTAKGVQQSVGTMLGVGAAGNVALATLAVIAAIKAVEYGCLGLAVGWVERQRWGGLAAYLGIGLCIGLVFGSAIWAVSPAAAIKPASAALMTWAVNEVLFPAGCAAVLFGSNVIGKRLAG
jgi:hypothetical protein